MNSPLNKIDAFDQSQYYPSMSYQDILNENYTMQSDDFNYRFNTVCWEKSSLWRPSNAGTINQDQQVNFLFLFGGVGNKIFFLTKKYFQRHLLIRLHKWTDFSIYFTQFPTIKDLSKEFRFITGRTSAKRTLQAR